MAPPLGAHYELARLRGWIHDRLLPVPTVIRRNVESMLGSGPESERLMRWAHGYFFSFRFMYIMQRLRGFHDPERWAVEGRERLDAALSGGRGVVLVNAHMGYAHAVGPVLRLHGYPLTQIAAPGYLDAGREARDRYLADGSRFRRWIYERTRVDGDILEPVDLAASLDVRPILRALERNRVVVIAGDAKLGLEFREFPILGMPFRFPTGFVKLALRAGCPVLPVFGVAGGRRHPIVLEIEEPVAIDASASLSDNLAGYVHRFEARFRRAPHTWHRWWSEEALEKNEFHSLERGGDPYRVRRR